MSDTKKMNEIIRKSVSDFGKAARSIGRCPPYPLGFVAGDLGSVGTGPRDDEDTVILTPGGIIHIDELDQPDGIVPPSDDDIANDNHQDNYHRNLMAQVPAAVFDFDDPDSGPQLLEQHAQLLDLFAEAGRTITKLTEDGKLLDDERVDAANRHADAMKYVRENLTLAAQASDLFRADARGWMVWCYIAWAFAAIGTAGLIVMLFVNASH